MSAAIEILRGDITTQEVDAIVNAANSNLQHGGGVAAAISSRGGPSIQAESDRISYVPVGSAVSTTAGDLPAKWVIHTVGPRMGEGDEARKLRSSIRSALELADRLEAESVALPAISTGIFGYPVERAAPEMIDEAIEVSNSLLHVRRIIFCLFDEPTRLLFSKVLEEQSR